MTTLFTSSLARMRLPWVLATFVYNGDGERVKSILDGTTTAFVGNHLEWTGSMGTMKKYYYAGSQRVAVQNGMLAPPNYLLGDHLGSTSVTTNSAGNLVAEMLYKPFGEVRYTSGTTPTQYTYTGQYSNMAEIGLMYYNTRWYDPYLNRWVQPDSIIPDPGNPQDWNRYSYVRDNPLKYTDPTGHWACGDYYDTGCVETFAEAGAMMRSTGMNALAGGKTTLPIVARKDWGQYAPGDNPGNFSDEDRETYDPNNEFGGYYEYPGNLADTLDSAVIHHVGDGGVTNSPQAIENAHMVGLGHYDVGYHFIAGADGTIYEGRYIGARGYHVQKYNTGKIGVVLIGDFSGDISPTQIQVDATLGLLLYLDAKYGIDFVNGHSDYPDQGNTICPGQNMAKPINMFRSFIE